MGVGVLILGSSGSGKSTSLRNFNRGEVGIINVVGKPLPFRNDLEVADVRDYPTIYKTIAGGKRKAYVIDDANYLMQFENFKRLQEKGYDKFSQMAHNFELLLEGISQAPKDEIVYVMAHPQTNEDGSISTKTIGKMLDNQLTIEGLFTIVLITGKDDKGHWFYTNNLPNTPAKSPIDMFEDVIPNDLKKVDTAIRKYYNLAPLTHDVEKKGAKNG